MSVIQKARELGAEVQKDERYLKLRLTLQNNDGDTELQGMIDQLNAIREDYNEELSKEQEGDQEKVQKLSDEFGKLYQEVMQKPNMVAYTEAKQEVDVMMNEVTQILMLCVNGEDPETCEPPQQCGTGGCDSCSGCQ